MLQSIDNSSECHLVCTPGPYNTLVLKECGPGRKALAYVLEDFCVQFSDNIHLDSSQTG